MQAYLQSIQNMGSLTVTRSRDCAGYSWSVRWNEGGNKFPINVFTNERQLIYLNSNHKIYLFILNKIVSNSLQGNLATVATQTSTDGGVLFNPILDNMLRSYHTVPQV